MKLVSFQRGGRGDILGDGPEVEWNDWNSGGHGVVLMWHSQLGWRTREKLWRMRYLVAHEVHPVTNVENGVDYVGEGVEPYEN